MVMSDELKFSLEKTKEVIDKDPHLRHAYDQLDGDTETDLAMIFDTFIKGNEELERKYRQVSEQNNVFLEFFRDKIEESNSKLKERL